MTSLFLGVFGISLLLSFVLTRSVRNFWIARGWVTQSARDLDLHPVPPPRIGGVAIYLSFVITIGIAFVASRYFPKLGPAFANSSLLTILLPGTLIFALGVRDDLRSVGPYTKFAVQALAGTMLFAGGLRIVYLPVLFGTSHFGWEFGLPLTILWVIGITNAFNLIDGLDGLAAGSALFSTLVVFVVAIFGQFPPRLVTDYRTGWLHPRISPIQFQSGNDLSRRLRQPIHRIHALCVGFEGHPKSPYGDCGRDSSGVFRLAHTGNCHLSAASLD